MTYFQKPPAFQTHSNLGAEFVVAGSPIPVIKVGDYHYVDPTHPGHAFFEDEPQGAKTPGLWARWTNRLGK